jgi:hypothetical protein
VYEVNLPGYSLANSMSFAHTLGNLKPPEMDPDIGGLRQSGIGLARARHK